jgi:hypothetical protein
MCRLALNGVSGGKSQAEIIDKNLPHCGCEAFSVGSASPGVVKSDEYVYRLIITPGDIDEPSGKLMLTALNDLRSSGLSVFRECASDEDVSNLVIDRLSRTPDKKQAKTVHALLRIQASAIRRMREATFGRYFCVYDETVPRKEPEKPMVPTHATVLQRLLPAGADNRKALNTKISQKLFEEIRGSVVDVNTFRNGLLANLNQRSLAGDFIISEKAA